VEAVLASASGGGHPGQEEARLHEQVCRQFRHDRRSFALPEQSVLRQDLFSRTTWTVSA
jgi:hypothetical protein